VLQLILPYSEATSIAGMHVKGKGGYSLVF